MKFLFLLCLVAIFSQVTAFLSINGKRQVARALTVNMSKAANKKAEEKKRRQELVDAANEKKKEKDDAKKEAAPAGKKK